MINTDVIVGAAVAIAVLAIVCAYLVSTMRAQGWRLRIAPAMLLLIMVWGTCGVGGHFALPVKADLQRDLAQSAAAGLLMGLLIVTLLLIPLPFEDQQGALARWLRRTFFRR